MPHTLYPGMHSFGYILFYSLSIVRNIVSIILINASIIVPKCFYRFYRGVYRGL
ncbi:hypothetical protein NXV35_24830 [Bacteroides faecis]|nr:hypothetical protein [Bacteroides faecis]